MRWPSFEAVGRMKGFPLQVDGPMGPWYRKVNEMVANVQVGDTKSRLVELLGEPDEIRGGTHHPGQALQELMENVAGGPTVLHYGSKDGYDEILVYRDPYRLPKSYVFAIGNSMIAAIWRETSVG
jgi:hypothetical protein